MDGRVLIVEDDHSINEVARVGLERAGFNMTVVADGRRALDLSRSGLFDLLVLDVMLPVVDGFEVCREIRRASTTPIIMLAAAQPERASLLQVGGLEIDEARFRVRRDGDEIRLSATEFT